MKNTEELNTSPTETPNIVLCSDPPHIDPDTDFIRESSPSLTSKPINLQLGRIKTTLKGVCNFLPSFTNDGRMKPQLCFNASSTVRMYAILPGKQIFVSNFHPIKTIESSEVSGGKFFRMIVMPKQSEYVSDTGDCINNGSDMESIRRTYNEYETCILENMLKSFNQNGTTYYHPILDNYPQYETLKVQENVVKELDSIQSYQFSSSIEDAFHKCKKPCTDIEYKIGKDSYLLGTPDETAVNSGCQPGEGVINFQFSKMWEFAKEDYIIKQVDLLAGFGGAMGLWLGWSVMTLGELTVTLIKAFRASISTNK